MWTSSLLFFSVVGGAESGNEFGVRYRRSWKILQFRDMGFGSGFGLSGTKNRANKKGASDI